MIFFYSQNNTQKKIGVYGDPKFYHKHLTYNHEAFENNIQEFNISGKKSLSLGFINETHLEVKPEYMNGKHVGQSNLIYITSENAKKILLDVSEKYRKLIQSKSEYITEKQHLLKLERLIH